MFDSGAPTADKEARLPTSVSEKGDEVDGAQLEDDDDAEEEEETTSNVASDLETISQKRQEEKVVFQVDRHVDKW